MTLSVYSLSALVLSSNDDVFLDIQLAIDVNISDNIKFGVFLSASLEIFF